MNEPFKTQAVQDCQSALHNAGLHLPLLRTEGPTFCEPWQAQAFAMTLALHQRGLFEWSQWAQTLSEVIRQAQQAGDPDRGDTYYEHWLTALERVVTASHAVQADVLARRQQAWRDAAARTPHGLPIELTEQDRQH